MALISRKVHSRFVTVIGCNVVKLVRLRLKCTRSTSVDVRRTLTLCSGCIGRTLRLVLTGGRSCSRT